MANHALLCISGGLNMKCRFPPALRALTRLRNNSYLQSAYTSREIKWSCLAQLHFPSFLLVSQYFNTSLKKQNEVVSWQCFSVCLWVLLCVLVLLFLSPPRSTEKSIFSTGYSTASSTIIILYIWKLCSEKNHLQRCSCYPVALASFWFHRWSFLPEWNSRSLPNNAVTFRLFIEFWSNFANAAFMFPVSGKHCA